MSTIATSKMNTVNTNFGSETSKQEIWKTVKPQYMTKPLSSRSEFTGKLTAANRKNFETGYKFREQYVKFRLLSLDEEKVAGKFSIVGRRLDSVRKALETELGREPTKDEWAMGCKLTKDELQTYRDLSKTARRRLVQHNFRLVDFWARRLIEHTKGAQEISYYELFTEGVVGLMSAAERYDGRGAFIKFAQPHVRHELYKGMTRLRPGSFLSHNTMMTSFRAKRAADRLEVSLGRPPTQQEVAKELKIAVRTLQAELGVVALKKTVISANSGTDNGSSDRQGSESTQAGGKSSEFGMARTYLDILQRPDSSVFATDNLQWKIEFNQALEVLTPIERRTLSIRYGLTDGKPLSIERVGELMCLSSEGIRKIILRSLEKLRESSYRTILEQGPPSMPTSSDFNGRQLTKAAY